MDNLNNIYIVNRALPFIPDAQTVQKEEENRKWNSEVEEGEEGKEGESKRE